MLSELCHFRLAKAWRALHVPWRASWQVGKMCRRLLSADRTRDAFFSAASGRHFDLKEGRVARSVGNILRRGFLALESSLERVRSDKKATRPVERPLLVYK